MSAVRTSKVFSVRIRYVSPVRTENVTGIRTRYEFIIRTVHVCPTRYTDHHLHLNYTFCGPMKVYGVAYVEHAFFHKHQQLRDEPDWFLNT